MPIGLGPGIDGAPRHESTYYVYDARTGAIVATYHFAGAAPKAEAERMEGLRQGTHETSGVPVEHLGVLSAREAPPGEGVLRVDHAAQKLVRATRHFDPRIRP